MRYIIINEFYKFGGSEVQSLREKHFFEYKGHDVLYITLDPNLPHGWNELEKNHFNINLFPNKIKKIISSLHVDKRILNILEKIITDFSPECIHVNAAFNTALTIYEVVKKYNCFQTIRDYSAICLNGRCVDKGMKVCDGYQHNRCFMRCMPATEIRATYNFYKNYINNKKRKCSIDHFICPSKKLTSMGNANGYKVACVNNPFDFSLLDGFKKEFSLSRKIYMFYGALSKNKGVIQFLEAFDKFSEKHKDVCLLIAGKVMDKDVQNSLEQICMRNKKVEYKGRLEYYDIIKILQRVYAVVVPSLWMENYPNTVLEGLATECLVLGSNRGGMQEMIADDRFIFDVLNEEDIIDKLETSYSLSNDEMFNIIRSNKDRIMRNNSLEVYYQRILYLLHDWFGIE